MSEKNGEKDEKTKLCFRTKAWCEKNGKPYPGDIVLIPAFNALDQKDRDHEALIGVLVGTLKKLEPSHYNVEEDCWFSCPQARDYCNDKYIDTPREERPCECSYKTEHPVWEEALSHPLVQEYLKRSGK